MIKKKKFIPSLFWSEDDIPKREVDNRTNRHNRCRPPVRKGSQSQTSNQAQSTQIQPVQQPSLRATPWDPNRYILADKLGEGTFGKVFIAQDRTRQQSDAWKAVDAQRRAAHEALQVARANMLKRIDELLQANFLDDAQNLMDEYKNEDLPENGALYELESKLRQLDSIVIKVLDKIGNDLQDVEREARALKRLRSVCQHYILCWDGGFFEDAGHYYLTTELLLDFIPLGHAIQQIKTAAYGSFYQRPPPFTPTPTPAVPIPVKSGSGGNTHPSSGGAILPNPNSPPTKSTGMNIDERMVQLFANLVNGLKVIHTAGVAHRDIKPMNILVNWKGSQIKYIDFGGACIKGEPTCLQNGTGMTFVYCPREIADAILDKKILTFDDYRKADLWSLGMTLYEVLSPWTREIAATRMRSYIAYLWDIVNEWKTVATTGKISPKSPLLFSIAFDYHSPCDELSMYNARMELELMELKDRYNTDMDEQERTTGRSQPRVRDLTLKGLLQRDPNQRVLPNVLPPRFTTPPTFTTTTPSVAASPFRPFTESELRRQRPLPPPPLPPLRKQQPPLPPTPVSSTTQWKPSEIAFNETTNMRNAMPAWNPISNNDVNGYPKVPPPSIQNIPVEGGWWYPPYS